MRNKGKLKKQAEEKKTVVEDRRRRISINSAYANIQNSLYR